MTITVIFLATISLVYLATMLGYAPDTHAEVTQFGDYKF
jgi:hypothetical protein